MKRFLIITLSALALLSFTATSFASFKYLATGVGKEERAMPQPKGYSLKLILATKDGCYLAFVTLKVFKGDKLLATIPPQEVKGPWVYLDLPAGNYKIIGIRKNGQKSKVYISVPPKGMKTVYMWF